MKIERISENQIKCTLTRSDLASRQLKLSELAYGTEKARGLFRDMMEQASLEFGFEASDIPLMIEAIPVSMDCIILMITKVENPDEVDTRFSSLSSLKDLFAGTASEEDAFDFSEDQEEPFSQIEELLRKFPSPKSKAGEYLYSFHDLETVIDFAHHIKNPASLKSTLYKSSETGKYYLHLTEDGEHTAETAAVLSAALEFADQEPCNVLRDAYMKEHFELLLQQDALARLAYV